MQQDAPTRSTDGQNDFSYGMDSSRTPEVIAPNAVALGVNAVFRTGWARTRPSFRRFFMSPVDVWTKFATAFFQGAAPYSNTTTGNKKVVVVASGRVYVIDPLTKTIEDLTLADDVNDAEARHYFAQAEGFLVIQNGQDKALIYDGKTLRRATKDEVPVGSIMAYGQGRLFVVASDYSRVYCGDLAYGGSTSQVDISGSERILTYATRNKVQIDETKVKVSTKNPHGYVTGDTVTIQNHSSTPDINGTWTIFEVGTNYFHIASKLDSPGVGGQAQKANDGKDRDCLRFTEQNYLNEKGIFRLPAYMGKITGLSFYAVQDTGTGQGDLLLFGERGVASLAVALPRDQWLNTTAQRIAMTEVGSTSPEAIVPVNGDVFFRSLDGLRSYRSARGEIAGYGHAPVSAEMNRVLDLDSARMLPHASAVLFDNRLLFTSSPVQLARSGTVTAPTIFQTLTVLDFHSTSRIAAKGSPAYDGVWTGLNVQKLFTQRLDGVNRCFAFSLNTTTHQTELWEITKDQSTGTDYADEQTGETITRLSQPIKAAIESRALNFNSQFQMKKLLRGDLWLSDLLGNTSIRVYFRPDGHPRWFYWTGFEVDVAACANVGTVGCGNPPVSLMPAISPQITLGTPQDYEDPDVLVRRVDRGFNFQTRIEWDGRLTLQKVILYADGIVEQVSGPCPNILPRTVKKCVNPAPDSPAVGSLLSHHSI